MASVTPLFGELQRRYPGLFEVRYLPFAPPVGMFLRDPGEANELLKVEIYAVKPWSASMSRPHFIVPARSAWREFWLQQVENLWTLGNTAPQDALCRFAVLIRSGSDNVDDNLVSGLIETEMLSRAIDLCASSDSMTKLRQFGLELVKKREYEAANRVAEFISMNPQELSKIPTEWLRRFQTEPVLFQQRLIAMTLEIFPRLRDPHRNRLREHAEKMGIRIEWPEVEPNP
jgi:hypothetical protein